MKKTTGNYLFLSMLFLALPICSSAQESETKPLKEIQQLMPPGEFRDAGLDKLTPEELDVLNKWLYGYIEVQRKAAVDEIVPEGEKGFGLELVKEEVVKLFRDTPDEIECALIMEGKFSGWDGEAVFKLENGQIWKQVDKSSYYYPTSSPVVVIRKGAFGSYFLSIKGKGSKCKVVRIK
ncbi:MAG: hypothetical protein JW739_07165 [Opitutales bacterium]|nr:hypothetical protein [Opitutales bacterium]